MGFPFLPGQKAIKSASGGNNDPYFAQVVFLSGFEGADGATAVVDESSYGHAVTVAGGAALSTAQFKFGASSLLKTADGQNCFMADAPEWTLSTNHFTIEGFWRWTTVIAAARTLVSHWATASNQRGWNLQWSGTNLLWQVSSSGVVTTNKINVAWAPNVDQWYYICVDFDGITYRLYVDGIVIGSSGGVVDIFDCTANLRIGGVSTGTTSGFIGYHDEIRITNGTGRYASNAGMAVPIARFPRN